MFARLRAALSVFISILFTGKETGLCDRGIHGPWKEEWMGFGWDRSTCCTCGYYEDNGERGQLSRPRRMDAKGDAS